MGRVGSRAGTRCARIGRVGSRAAPHVLAALFACAGVLAMGGGSASALVGRGHVFDSSLEGSGEAALKEPSGVAVVGVWGVVYVVDRGHERVERFTPDGSGGYQFASAFKVDSPGAIAIDNSANPSDPSRGDVYVAGAGETGAEASGRDYIYKFTASGEKVMKKAVFKATEGGEHDELELEDIEGLAVDQSGTLWVYWEEEGELDGFDDALTNKWTPSLTPAGFGGAEARIEECVARPDFAVGGSDESFYVGYERENGAEECPGAQGESPDPTVAAKLDGSGDLISREVDHANTTGIAVDESGGDAYLDNGTSVGAYTSDGQLIQRFGDEQLHAGAGLAVDSQSGQVFVAEPGEDKVDVFGLEPPGPPVIDGVSSQDLTSSSALLRAQVDPEGAETEYQFQYGAVECAQAPSSCVQVPVPAGEVKAGFGDQTVSVEVGGLQPATAYYYRLLATNSLGGPVAGVPSPNTFTTLPSPSLLPDGRAWELVSPADKHGASVEALPREGGAMIMAAAQGGAITWVANGPVVSEPQGNRSPELSQLLSVRSSAGWQTESLETPHERGWGIAKTEPFGVEYQAFSPELSLGLVQPAIPVVSGEPDIGLMEAPPLSPSASEKTMYLRANPAVAPEEGEQGSYDAAASEANRSYLAPGFLPLVTVANDTAKDKFGGALNFLGATPDLSHVVFGSTVGLTSAAPSAGGLYEWEAAGQRLQLISVLPGQAPAAEPFLGDGQAQNAEPGVNARHAISDDGSRVFWTDGKEHLYVRDTETQETIQVNAAQGHDATEAGAGRQEVAEPAEGRQEVHFQTASSDGSKVFFTDTARLTEDSTLEPVGGEEGPADLYELELTSTRGEPLRGRLVDLTPVATQASADVLNLIPGASEDGSYVYFVANGVLAPGAVQGHCPRYYDEEATPPPGATCNLYVSEPDPEDPGQRVTKFIASLSYEDGADWGAGPSSALTPEQDLSTVSSRVSPNGRYLAFMSAQSLTGYDNEDLSSRHPGERLDEEVFLYDADTGRLLCASCNPSGARPTGVYDSLRSGEGVGLLVDRTENWRGHWLAGSLPAWTLDYGRETSASYQSRYLSNSGRLFFNGADPLAPGIAVTSRKEEVNGAQENVGVENVYEYEPAGVGSCEHSGGCVGLISSGTSSQESAFLDASETGDDVFFLTAAALVPQDTDNAFDIYDARVCTEAAPCLSSPTSSSGECESSAACRPQAPSQPQASAPPASATFSGPGNGATTQVLSSKTSSKPKPATRSEKLARALEACRKLEARHRRAACEAKARRQFGAKHAKKAKPGEKLRAAMRSRRRT
jgi:hypothetical protein